ncbi:uncharacterized protein LTR77_009303 [Saxophila tyrrhenica]|uniref:beta-glucosidase n=1 Tax=Saxophila tyrrhenica TaxID=1690608 RepID=A0AAV9NZB0_9PEZI|nr:hypothetical protein LTR77_009303 [Saxophila tyrrhenica]
MATSTQTRSIEERTSDGPAGVRGNLLVGGPLAAFLPAPISQAATWCKADLKALGRLLSREARSKSTDILLAPTVCCVRNPLGGRNFETFSEDPFLNGALGIEYVAGVQESREVVATVKHFVANEQESERFSINAVIEEHALREIYLRPFEMLIRSATPPGCVMTAYNQVNGAHVDMSKTLIQKTLRDEWKFDGLVMSDWGGTNSTVESVIAGCDLEMAGPSVHRGQKLMDALMTKPNPGLRDAIYRSCGRVLSLAKKMNLLGLSPKQVRESRNRTEISANNALDLEELRRIAASGHVLLKNATGTLPLRPSALQGKKVAFVGPNSKVCSPGGGGSATMNPQYLSHPFEAFKQALTRRGIDAEVHHAPGAYTTKWLPLLHCDQWTTSPSRTPEAEHESNFLRVDFFASPDLRGPIFETQYRSISSIDLTDSGPPSLRESGQPYSLRVTSHVRPKTSGKHAFGIASVGHSKLWVDGQCLIDNYDWTQRGEAFYAFSSTEACASVQMDADQWYEVVLEAASKTGPTSQHDAPPTHVWSTHPSVRLGFLEELAGTLIADAVALANESDYTVVVTGLNEEWESEGYDRQTMRLPGVQDELVKALLDQTTKAEDVIIVNQSGSAVEMPWAEKAYTILQAWYGGQEAGNALADVLLGVTSPSGRLPFTWPRRYKDLHFSGSKKAWPGVDGDVHYSEGTDVGYRWYLKNQVQPQWWFGHGLGYTRFKVQELRVVERPGQGWDVVVRVQNTGSVEGREVVQVYSWPQDRVDSKELMAFEKTRTLAAGAEETVTLQVQLRDMAHWREGRWILEAGTYMLGIGENAGTMDMVVEPVVLKETMTWDP